MSETKENKQIKQEELEEVNGGNVVGYEKERNIDPDELVKPNLDSDPTSEEDEDPDSKKRGYRILA